MIYGEREIIDRRLSKIEKRLENPREIVFHLNDYSSQAEKNYYFCFEASSSGYVKIEALNAGQSCNLTLNGVKILLGEYFYLEKGVYEILLQAVLEDALQPVKVSVFGEVCYHDNSQIKVLSATDYSIIASICAGQLSIYYYDGNIAEVDRIETEDYDMELSDELTVYYLTQTGIEKKVYIYPFTAGVVTAYPIEGATGIRCSGGKLYIVKAGRLYLVTFDSGSAVLSECNLEVKDIFAIDGNRVVYRDYNGKIKLSDFSVSP